MGLVNTKKMLEDARLKGYAVGAYNIFNLETLKAVVKAGEEMNTPIIIQASESVIKYVGINTLVSMVKAEVASSKVDFALHLDHGKSVEICKECIDAGFTSVMIDMSASPYQENVKATKEVVKYAKIKNVTVEAELGKIKGTEDNVKSESNNLTDPNEAITFIKETGVDSLAVSIGTAHGVNKGTNTPKIHFEILERLEKLLPPAFPLVCHGASTIDESLVNNFIKSGGVLKKAQGILASDLKKLATTTPISKINVDTDLRLAFTGELRNILKQHPEYINPRDYLSEVIEHVKNRVIYSSEKIFK